MKHFNVYLLFLATICLTTRADVFFNNVRTGGGDLTNLNTLLNGLILSLDLDIEPKSIDYSFGILTIPLLATIGEVGECRDLLINEGGDISVTGSFLPDKVTIEGFDEPMSVYEIEILAEVIQFECTIPLMVEVEGFFSFVNTVDGFGDLTFRSQAASLNQKILAFSPDFQNFPPLYSTPGNCVADPDVLAYEGDSLGDVAGVDITGIVIGELESDPSYVFNDVALELCKLGTDLAQQISDILVSDILTDIDSDFFLGDPFTPDENGVIPALKSQNKIYEEQPEAVEGLLDMTDSSNFFVDLIVAENNSESSVLYDILELFVDTEGSDIDPALLIIAQLLNFTLEPNGDVIDFDLYALLGDKIEITFNEFLNETLIINVSLSVDEILFDLIAPKPLNPGEDAPPILPPFQALSNQTLFLKDVNLNRFNFEAKANLNMSLVNLGLEGNDFLEQPFDLQFQEDFTLNFDWEGFLLTFGVLFAFNVDYLKETEVGPIVLNFVDCLLAVFPLAPVITGATVSHEKIDIILSQFDDSILVLLADIVQVALPAYQMVIPRLIEILVADTVTDIVFFNETECPLADPSLNNLETHAYDFSEGMFQDLADLLTAETLNDLFSNFQITDNGIYIVGDVDGFEVDSGLDFSIPFPIINGWRQNLTIGIQAFSLEGFLPPFFRDIKVFETIQSEYYPQFLRNTLNVGTPDDPVQLRLVLNVTAGDPYVESDITDAAEVPPSIYYRQENLLNISFETPSADVILDLYLKYTQYDVDGFQIQEIINLGCWGSRLDYPGGISYFTVDVTGLNTIVECDCENEMVLRMADSFSNDESWPEQEIFLDDILNRFGFLLKNLFEADRFPITKQVSQLVCDELDYGPIGTLTTYEFHEYHTDFAVLLPFMALFFLAILMPTLVARLLNNYGPKLKTIHKHHLNAETNKLFVADARLSNDKDAIDKIYHLETAMYQNPLISKKAKIMFPVMLVINFILFIIGDTGDAVRINVLGHFFLVPYEADNFKSLSVLSSVFELYSSGGWVLGTLLLVLSILWPYVKLIIMSICWFTTTRRLSVNRRGKIIEFLDFFGRFSFAEFHFLVFVLVVFQLEAGTPKRAFLPEEDFFFIGLEIEPLLSLFTFSLAVVLSIMVSNAMLVYQHNIEDESRIKERERAVKEVGGDELNCAALTFDKKQIKVTNWDFQVDEINDEAEAHYLYKYKITQKATGLIAGIVLLASTTLLAAASVATLKIEIFGFFGYLVLFAGGEPKYSLSVFDLLFKAIELYSDNAIVYFVGAVFILTIVIIPMIQTLLLFVLLFKPVSLEGARKLTEAHHVLSVWCCIDVFVLALTLTVLELPTVAGGLAGNLEFCDELGEVMYIFFEPMQYVTDEDVDAGCLAMKSSIVGGGYIAVLAVFILNLANFFVSRMFYSYIAGRECFDISEVTKKGYSIDIKSYHQRLQYVGLITIDTAVESKFSQANMYRESQQNPMFGEDKTKEKQGSSFFSKVSQSNPMFSSSPSKPSSNKDVVANGNPFFNSKNDTDRLTLTTKLDDFYNEVDPKRKSNTKALVDKALSTPDGLGRLNTKLKKKYGRGISLEVSF